MTVVVSGFRETAAAFGRVNKQFPKDLRKELLASAQPVAVDASRYFGSHLRHLGEGDPWAKFRVGGGVKIVYIAPLQRGRKSRHDPTRRRPLLAPHILAAMEESMERNKGKVEADVFAALGRMEKNWGLGG